MKPEYGKARGFTLFSEKLLDGIKKRMASGEQTLLFLNRRGFHTSSVCEACSEALQCPNCSITLTFHKGENILSCHLCNYETRPLTECPSCKAKDSFKFKAPAPNMSSAPSTPSSRKSAPSASMPIPQSTKDRMTRCSNSSAPEKPIFSSAPR